MLKTRHCDECKRAVWLRDRINCEAGHKPRFYSPRGPYDFQMGYKRKCEDFVEDFNGAKT